METLQQLTEYEKNIINTDHVCSLCKATMKLLYLTNVPSCADYSCCFSSVCAEGCESISCCLCFRQMVDPRMYYYVSDNMLASGNSQEYVEITSKGSNDTTTEEYTASIATYQQEKDERNESGSVKATYIDEFTVLEEFMKYRYDPSRKIKVICKHCYLRIDTKHEWTETPPYWNGISLEEHRRRYNEMLNSRIWEEENIFSCLNERYVRDLMISFKDGIAKIVFEQIDNIKLPENIVIGDMIEHKLYSCPKGNITIYYIPVTISDSSIMNCLNEIIIEESLLCIPIERVTVKYDTFLDELNIILFDSYTYTRGYERNSSSDIIPEWTVKVSDDFCLLKMTLTNASKYFYPKIKVHISDETTVPSV